MQHCLESALQKRPRESLPAMSPTQRYTKDQMYLVSVAFLLFSSKSIRVVVDFHTRPLVREAVLLTRSFHETSHSFILSRSQIQSFDNSTQVNPITVFYGTDLRSYLKNGQPNSIFSPLPRSSSDERQCSRLLPHRLRQRRLPRPSLRCPSTTVQQPDSGCDVFGYHLQQPSEPASFNRHH